ncbi:MAG TPA: asparaginase [Sulfurimonas sp. UBA12504]|nr:MAG: asparaginase [Sulfurimonas sp. GWF2_37_8]DAB30501.1 MAG TPA: asparaginase [Sulfurimonas sp. UBA12504]
MLILNSGGTFNKRYNPLSGELDVPYDNLAIEAILTNSDCVYTLAGVIYKDSLEMDLQDRKQLANIVSQSNECVFVIVHGTDTMDKSAAFLSEIFTDKIIILTGAMRPFEIDKVEASFNLGMAIGFAKAAHENGIYICMSGHVKKWDALYKNKQLGKFELVK